MNMRNFENDVKSHSQLLCVPYTWSELDFPFLAAEGKRLGSTARFYPIRISLRIALPRRLRKAALLRPSPQTQTVAMRLTLPQLTCPAELLPNG